MLTFSPVCHGRLRAARGLSNLLLQTLVIHPALLFFLLFLLMSHNAGGAGRMLLYAAENLVRNAPAGQVWDCASQTPPATTLHQSAPAPCIKSLLSAEAWAARTDGTLRSLYECGVLLSFTVSLAMWALRRRKNGEIV
ncbi:hypothetical protein F3J38_26245 [Pantoea sp. Acro-805]|uniref:Disulfide bond formation protein B n=1 Tax=Candidatus Pantoea formicae TaxID=2608355 RepID=A0ABX0R884_9GAMM|nr:hypothetical protein [Pantoea formicae]NIF03506.1 hypothetical protein [Pantoea formicae]